MAVQSGVRRWTSSRWPNQASTAIPTARGTRLPPSQTSFVRSSGRRTSNRPATRGTTTAFCRVVTANTATTAPATHAPGDGPRKPRQ